MIALPRGFGAVRRHGLRLAGAVVTVWLVVTLAFVLVAAAPGGVGAAFDDPGLTPEARARLRADFGLDRPVPVQYFAWLGQVVRGDLGISLQHRQPVATLIAAAAGPTLILAGSALTLAFVLGLCAGTRAAVRPGGIADRLTRIVLPALDALPPFWLGLLGIWLFAWKLGWLPASHLHGAEGGGLRDLLVHLVLPALVVGVPGAAPVARHHAAALRRELDRPHVRTARAMGLSEGRVVFARALRCALQPAIALFGLGLPALAGGTAVVEVVFSWPGLGRLQQEALLGRDLPLALGGLLFTAALVVAGRALSDLLAALADPRWRDGDAA